MRTCLSRTSAASSRTPSPVGLRRRRPTKWGALATTGRQALEGAARTATEGALALTASLRGVVNWLAELCLDDGKGGLSGKGRQLVLQLDQLFEKIRPNEVWPRREGLTNFDEGGAEPGQNLAQL